MLLHLLFDSLLSICPKKMETEKWIKAADSPLLNKSIEHMEKCMLYRIKLNFNIR